MKKTLYFEGAGMFGVDGCGDLNNPRIRTAFHLDDGTPVYLEITRGCNAYAGQGFIWSCSVISEDFASDWAQLSPREYIREYSAAGVLKFVNGLGCSFDAVEVLPNLAGYRVFRNDPARMDRCNFGDEFRPDPELIAAREALYDRIYAQEKARGEKHPCFSLWVDDDEPAMLHFHNCRNGGIHCPAFFVGIPQDPRQLPALTADNAMEGCYYAFCDSWHQLTHLYSFTEQEALENDCIYLDRYESKGPNGCTISAALHGSRVRKTRTPLTAEEDAQPLPF